MPKFEELRKNLYFSNEKAELVWLRSGWGIQLVLCEHEIVQDEFFNAVADGVHTAGMQENFSNLLILE